MGTTGYAPVNGARLYYEEDGAGEPLLLIHAGVADNRMWDGQMASFAQYFRTIRFDMRGFGMSQMPAGEFCNYGDVAGLLDALEIEQARIVASSFGGLIALDFALACPERVAALALAAPSVSGSEPSERIKAFWEEEEAACDRGDLDGATELNLKLWVDGPRRQPGGVDAGVRELVGKMQREIFEMDIPDDIDEREPAPAAGRLGDIQAPTLVVVGALDLEEKVAQAKQVADEVANGRCEVIEGAAHMVNMEKAEEFNRIVLDFLSA